MDRLLGIYKTKKAICAAILSIIIAIVFCFVTLVPADAATVYGPKRAVQSIAFWQPQLNYSTSSTATTYTIKADTGPKTIKQDWIALEWKATVYIAGTAVNTKSVGLTSVDLNEYLKLASGSKTITKTHSAQTIKVQGKVWDMRNGANSTMINTYKKKYGYEPNSTATATITVPAKTHYTVTYNANGGSSAPSAQTKWYGEKLTLTSSKPTRTGYTFTGWNTKANGTGTSYAAGGSYSSNAALTLYAQWKINTYNVAYNANGGSGAPSAQTKTYGKTLTLSSTKPTRTGYTFTGWNTAANGSGTSYAAGASYTSNSAATLYAQWKINTYNVAYNANGGSGAPAAQTKTYGKALTLSSAKPTWAGHTFTNWNTAANGSGTSYSPGGSYTANAAATLYAQWKLDTYGITYDANGGSNTPSAQTKTYGQDLTLSSTKPIKDGHTFTGWNTSKDGTGTSYAPGEVYTANTAATLYAQYTADKYEYVFDANGGSGGGKETVTYGTKFDFSSVETPTKTGYTFLGWSTSNTAQTPDYTSSDSVTIPVGGKTYYAVWKINTYNVTYDANGGSGAPEAQVKTHGTPLTLSTTEPTRENYIFEGWATSASAKTPEYYPGGSYTEEKGVTLYAVWSEKPIEITVSEKVTMVRDANTPNLTITPLVVNNIDNRALTVNSVKVSAANGWQIVGNDTDFAKMTSNQKKLSLLINGEETQELALNKTVQKGSSEEISFAGKTGNVTAAVNSEKALDIVVTYSIAGSTVNANSEKAMSKPDVSDPESEEPIIPKGATYYDASEDMLLKEGDSFPECDKGDIYTYDEREYVYAAGSDEDAWLINDADAGEENLLEEINHIPVKIQK